MGGRKVKVERREGSVGKGSKKRRRWKQCRRRRDVEKREVRRGAGRLVRRE